MSENFHGGSLDIGAGSSSEPAPTVIELNNLNNFFFLGPKKASGEDFGSMDSSDTTTYLSCCNTHPFPSQGSLAGLEALAAQGSMAPNGSINNSVYVNPFDPGRGGRGGGGPHHPPTPPKAVMTSTPPRGGSSPQRRVRIASGERGRDVRSRSSDLCEDLDLLDRETGLEYGEEDDYPPKHRRVRKSQVMGFFV
jgi:hypothetical protein